MNTHSIIGTVSCSLAKACKRLCNDEVIVNDGKGHSKHKKREDIQTLIKRVYHLQYKDGVMMVGRKKEYIGFRKGKENGISSMYNIICTLNLGWVMLLLKGFMCLLILY